MQYLDHVKLQAVLDGFTKRAFVPMPGGAPPPQPAAGASPMTAGMAAPMGGDPAAGGGMPPVDPATGMPMDPAMMMGGDPAAMGGGMPMDPAAMGGGMPMDPAMMGMDPAMMGAAPAGTVTMSIPELIQLIEVVKGGGGSAKPGADPAMGGGEEGGVPGEAKPKKAGGTAAVNEKLDTLIAALGLGGAPAGGMGAMPAPSPMPGM